MTLYLSIGPMFATPEQVPLRMKLRSSHFTRHDWICNHCSLLYSLAFSLWLSISPQKLVNRIGNILTPALLLVILLLIIKSFVTPVGHMQLPQPATPD